MTARSKSVIVSVIGQSNERGKRQLATVAEQDGAPTVALRGCPNADPIQPRGDDITPVNGYYGSLWPKVSEGLWIKRKIWAHFRNCAVGSTSWAQHWTGDSLGTGLGTPFSSSDAGWDQNGYLSAALTEVQRGKYDERWIFMANGQADSVLGVSGANYQLAIENIVNYYLANGIKVAIGFSVYNNSWSTSTGSPAVDAALATFAGNPNVIAGANLTKTLGTNPYMFDSHMGIRSYDRGSQDWVDALIAAGW